MLIIIDCWSAVPSLLPGHLAQLPAGLLRSGWHRRGRLLAGLQTQRFSLVCIFPQQYIFGIRELYIYLLLKLTHKCSSFSLAVLLWAEMSECMLRTQATVGRFICWKIFFWNDLFIRIKLNSHFFRIKILSSELEFIAHIDAEVHKKLAKYRRFGGCAQDKIGCVFTIQRTRLISENGLDAQHPIPGAWGKKCNGVVSRKWRDEFGCRQLENKVWKSNFGWVLANWRGRFWIRALVLQNLFSFWYGFRQFKILSVCRQLAELTLDGELMTSFSHRELKEPVSVVVNPVSGNWVVADIGARAVLVFEPSGKLVGMSFA